MHDKDDVAAADDDTKARSGADWNQPGSHLAISSNEIRVSMCRGLLNRTVPNQQVWRLMPKHKYFRPPSDTAPHLFGRGEIYIYNYLYFCWLVCFWCSGMFDGINLSPNAVQLRAHFIFAYFVICQRDSHA